jgi:DNA-binding XRE family transcriptional regulator
VKEIDNKNMGNASKCIAKLREELGLNQSEFARKIGVTSQLINKIEAETAKLSDINKRLICYTFGVRKEWLDNGTGKMFNEDITLTDQEKQIIEDYRQLSPTAKAEFVKQIKKELEWQRLRKADMQKAINEQKLTSEETAAFFKKIGDDTPMSGFSAIAKAVKTELQNARADDLLKKGKKSG